MSASKKGSTSSKGGSSGGGGESASARKQNEPSSDSPADPTPPLHRMHIWHFQAVRDVLVVAAIVMLIWLGYALSAVTVPLLVALLLAYLVEPLVQWLMKHPALKLTRLRAVTLILIVVIGMFLVVLALVIPLAVGQTVKLVRNYNDGTLRAQVSRVREHVPDFLTTEFENLLDVLPARPRAAEATDEIDAGPDAPADVTDPDEIPAEIPTEADVRRIVAEELALREQDGGYSRFAEQGFDVVKRVLGAVLTAGLLFGLIPFYFFFFSLWYPKVLAFFRQLAPEKNKERIFELVRKMDAVIAGFVRGRIVIAVIVGILLAFGWYLCGVPYAIVLGLVVGVFSIVPYLVGVGWPIAVALLFFKQLSLGPDERDIWLGWWGVLLWPTLVFVIEQIIETYILTPTIAGKATNLDPVTVVVAVIAGGVLLGVYGMLLAIPLAACLKILITDIIAPKVNAWLKGERADPLPFDRGD